MSFGEASAVIVQHPAEVRFGRNSIVKAQHLTMHSAKNTKGHCPKRSMKQEMLNGFGHCQINIYLSKH